MNFGDGRGLAVGADESAFEVLFDGESLDGWKGVEKFWSVKEGAIVGETTEQNPTPGNTFLVWQGADVGDFDFQCKARFQGNNSGVQYRSEIADSAMFAMRGYQADLHPSQEYFGMMYGERTDRGIIATRGQKVVVTSDGVSSVVGKVGDDAMLVDTQWNDLRIIAVGNRLIHQINGVTTIDLTDDHPQSFKSGKLGLQLHAGSAMKVEFRGLMLKRLDAAQGRAAIQEVAAVSPSPKSTEAADAWLVGKDLPNWIWADQQSADQTVWLRKQFRLNEKPASARLYASCDNAMRIVINGTAIGESQDWKQAVDQEVTADVFGTDNVIAVECKNSDAIAGLVLKLVLKAGDGSQSVVTDASWLATKIKTDDWSSATFDETPWIAATVNATLGDAPWGVPGYEGQRTGTADAMHPKNILAPPGFVVDRIYRIPSDQGSWVAMAVDPKGRIYACDQESRGLFRVTVMPSGPTKVEKVSVGNLASLSGAQGLLWAFDSLWFHQNGGHLQRLTDSDGDDVLDTAEVYPSATGGGEHGNHAVIVTEDGKGIYMDAGNHAPRAEMAASRVPSWSEGLLLPRMWDANGHARGLMAPGGWVSRLDIDAKTQTLYAVGFRNQYDITLNRDGDMFTFDADMEYDMGSPWYRPTRICHVVSGADFGWRSGTGKWPAYYEDSLPSVADIGPGSPTGVVSGQGTRFPTRYQDAVFALDWTFGTIYAVHLDPEGASYRGRTEPFVFGTPLPVTDTVVGHDGALYFAVGGRGMESTLFRIRYVGDESTANPADVAVSEKDEACQAARQTRRHLEAFHGVENEAAISVAWPYLSSTDRFIRHAARIAIESQTVSRWDKLACSEKNPQAAITSAVALARSGDESHRTPLIENLLSLRADELNDGQLLGLLRAYALIFIAAGTPDEAQHRRIVDQLDPLLPSKNDDVNAELVRVLTYLRGEQVIEKAMALINGRTTPQPPDWSLLASRNEGYGGSITMMLRNYPPAQEFLYAFMLRNTREGWTLDQRRQYFTFLNEAAKASGGASYPGFLTRTRDEALASCTDAERTALRDITGEDFNPVPDFEIVEPVGPGRVWDVPSALAALPGAGNVERGRSLYFSAKCASCHRMAGLGGNIGPDLTSIRNKFDERYLVEAIIHPSKNISDQYGSSRVLLSDGSTVVGLAVHGENGGLRVYPMQTDALPIDIDGEDIESVSPSPVSQMPENLLNTLNADEVRDLVTYLMSAGIK